MIVLKNGSRFGLLIKRARKYSHVILRGNGKLTIAKKPPVALSNAGWVEAPGFSVCVVAKSLLNHAAGLTDGARAALINLTTETEEAPVATLTRYRNLTNAELVREVEHLSNELFAELIQRLTDEEDENETLEQNVAEVDVQRENLQDENLALARKVASLEAELESLQAQITLLS